MANLYNVIEENPKIAEGFSERDIAAANYLYSMTYLTNSEITNDGGWRHTNSDYNEAVAKIIEAHPNAVDLIMSLKQDYSYVGGTESQFAYLLVDDYVNGNYINKSNSNVL